MPSAARARSPASQENRVSAWSTVVFPVPLSPSRIVHCAGFPFPSERSSACFGPKQRVFSRLSERKYTPLGAGGPFVSVMGPLPLNAIRAALRAAYQPPHLQRSPDERRGVSRQQTGTGAFRHRGDCGNCTEVVLP